MLFAHNFKTSSFCKMYDNFDKLIEITGKKWKNEPANCNNLPIFDHKEMYIKFCKSRMSDVESDLVDYYLSVKLHDSFYKQFRSLYDIIADDFLMSKNNRLNLLICALDASKFIIQRQLILDYTLRQILGLFQHSTNIKIFLINILLVFGSNPAIIQNEDIPYYVNNGVSITLFGKRGQQVIARHEKIVKILKIYLCNDIVGVVVPFVLHEYFDKPSNKNKICVVM